jgi:hypothetical protein
MALVRRSCSTDLSLLQLIPAARLLLLLITAMIASAASIWLLVRFQHCPERYLECLTENLLFSMRMMFQLLRTVLLRWSFKYIRALFGIFPCRPCAKQVSIARMVLQKLLNHYVTLDFIVLLAPRLRINRSAMQVSIALLVHPPSCVAVLARFVLRVLLSLHRSTAVLGFIVQRVPRLQIRQFAIRVSTALLVSPLRFHAVLVIFVLRVRVSQMILLLQVPYCFYPFVDLISISFIDVILFLQPTPEAWLVLNRSSPVLLPSPFIRMEDSHCLFK